MNILRIMVALVVSIMSITSAHTDEPELSASQLLEQMLNDSDHIRIGDAKLAFDDYVLGEENSAEASNRIDQLVFQVRAEAGAGASDTQLMAAMRKVVYEAGPWNDHRPFDYDFDDPTGKRAAFTTMSNYLETRLGNCVSMPILLLIIGERLGLNMTLTTAPQHVMIHFDPRDEAGDADLQRIEGTSGGFPQRVVWLQSIFPTMTDETIEAGMYLQRLSKKQSITIVAEVLLQHAQEKGDLDGGIAVANLILEQFPENDNAILHRRAMHDTIIRREIVARYPTFEEMPRSVLAEFEARAERVLLDEQKLAAMGWKPAPPPPMNR